MYTRKASSLRRHKWWQGLLARVTIAYAVGSLVLATMVASFTFAVAQNRLFDDLKQSSIDQFNSNAAEVRKTYEDLPDTENAEASAPQSLNQKLNRSDASTPILVRRGEQTGLSNIPEKDLPDSLRLAIEEQKRPIEIVATAETEQGSEKRYIIGMEMPDLDVTYYEVFLLADLEKTLSNLRNILIGAAFVSSFAGAALGYYAARRALAPVSRISNAAKEIAAGNFQTRLDLETDPDLAVLSLSFNEMVDALKDKIERDERFTSDVSHELRSPLMTLTASIEVLERRRNDLPDVAQQAVTLLSQDLLRFQKLVEDLLEISRMDAGAVQLQLSQFGLSEFLTIVIRNSATPEIELRHSTRDRDLTISADKRRLSQVISNLITNAAKYGGGAKAISYRKLGDAVQITVEDEGEGIPVKDRQRIFERFSRGGIEAGKRASGTGVGLGLSLVAEHVRLHGGKVWVSDRIDGKSGARFVVELPVGDQIDNDEEMAI